MLDLIYSSSILIDSCRCLPAQKKKKKYYFYHYYWRIIDFFWKPKNIEGTSDFPRCSAMRKISFECPLRWQCLFSFIIMHHNGFTKSFACCLSCESCLCAQCQMPGQGRRWCWDGRWGWAHNPGHPALKFLYIHSHQGKILHQSPPTPTLHPNPPNTTQTYHQNLGVSRTWEEYSFIWSSI